MPDASLDEIDFYLLDLIEYLDAYGVRGVQARRLLHERVALACEIVDTVDELALECVGGNHRVYH